MAEKIMNITASALKKTVEVALASQLDPIKKDLAEIKSDIRDFKTEMRMEIKDLKSEVKSFNTKLDYDRRLTVMEAEMREIRRKTAS
jgi:hypothetical protein